MAAPLPSIGRRRSGAPVPRPLRGGGTALAAAVGLGAAGGALCIAAVPAQAQTAKEEAVMTRARPDFDPIGIEIFFDEEQPGPPLTVFPTLDLRSGYDSNVFRERSGPDSDLFAEISPRIRVSNAGQDLGLEAAVSATARRNLEYKSNDFEDFDVYGQASYFFMGGSNLTGQIGYSRLHEDRADPDSTGPGENILQYDRYRAVLYSTNRFGDFLVDPQLEFYAYDYLDGDTATQSSRDRWDGVARVRIGYEFAVGYLAFVEPGYNVRRYYETGSSGVTRDSSGWDARLGLTYNVSAVTAAEVYVGYFQQDYEDSGLADVGGLTYGGLMTWNPFDVVTVNAAIDRSVQESTLAGVSGTVATSYSLGLDYEFAESLLLTASGGATTSSFEGSERDDLSYSFGGGLVYLANEFARARLNARYEARESSDDANNYEAMVVEAQVSLQY